MTLSPERPDAISDFGGGEGMKAICFSMEIIAGNTPSRPRSSFRIIRMKTNRMFFCYGRAFRYRRLSPCLFA